MKRKLDIAGLSRTYEVRFMNEGDADDIVAMFETNPLFLRYSEGNGSREEILEDMKVTPEGIAPSDKYYIGFFEKDHQTAVMDLIDGYPEEDIAFIGFFMVDGSDQGQGRGTAIIHETAEYLKRLGKKAIRLAVDRDNPQSNHFWKKNGFTILKEIKRNGWPLLYAEKKL